MAALVHGLGILRLLAAHRGSMSLSEIAEQIGTGKTTAFRLLGTLVQTGYIAQDPETKAYTID